jgi:hypothetical protein
MVVEHHIDCALGGQIGGQASHQRKALGAGRLVVELKIVVPARGFEPRTLGLKGRCSA